jgi:hypothetical protein
LSIATIILALTISCATIRPSSYCDIARAIPLNGELAIKVHNEYPETEAMYRGVKNHNDTYEAICHE